ncbi:riboflavin biosynthesis protein RibD, partial [Bordetella bronchiseptica]
MNTSTPTDDVSWMRRALALARSVMYSTAPNPRVGCVIVRDGQVLGEGATQPPGGPHAEVCALREAAARGASL